jgi:hypothetical protein
VKASEQTYSFHTDFELRIGMLAAARLLCNAGLSDVLRALCFRILDNDNESPPVSLSVCSLFYICILLVYFTTLFQ